MIDYLDKFNALPTDLRDSVSGPQAVAAITELEQQYRVSLATVVMRIMVKDISLVDLAKYFVFEYSLDARAAEELVDALKARVFFDAADYLGFTPEVLPQMPSESELDGWLNERQAETSVRGSSFFFSPEDEEEVRNLALKLNQYTPPRSYSLQPGSGQAGQAEQAIKSGLGQAGQTVSEMPVIQDKNSQAIADLAVEELNFNFSSSDLNVRFRQIIYTFVKGIRSRVDAKEALMKDVEVGGLGLNSTFADKALDVSRRIMIEYENIPRPGFLQPSSGQAGQAPRTLQSDSGLVPSSAKIYDERDLPYDFSKLPPKTIQSDSRLAPNVTPPALDLREMDQAALKEAERNIDKIIDLSQFAPETKPSQGLPLAPGTAGWPSQAAAFVPSASTSSPSASSHTGKVKVQDVKFVPKLMGPIDELKDMNLVNFRRLSPDPKTATGRIKEKMSFLEEDNYGQRLSGIKAWRESPINKMYLAIGRASIEGGQSVDTVIKDSRDRGVDCLTKQEFVAIMDLNKELRS